jgi:hypothetical protein
VRCQVAKVRGRVRGLRHGESGPHLVVRWRHRTLEGWAAQPTQWLVEFPVATPGAHARRSWSRVGVLWSSHSRSITSVTAGGFLPLAYRPSTSFAHKRTAGALGVECTRVLASRCAPALGRLAGCRTSSSHETARGFSSEPMATSARFPGDLFVPAGVPAVSGTRRRSDSEREAKGHERATEVVHPIKVSS